jgi:hypothetical protein
VAVDLDPLGAIPLGTVGEDASGEAIPLGTVDGDASGEAIVRGAGEKALFEEALPLTALDGPEEAVGDGDRLMLGDAGACGTITRGAGVGEGAGLFRWKKEGILKEGNLNPPPPGLERPPKLPPPGR